MSRGRLAGLRSSVPGASIPIQPGHTLRHPAPHEAPAVQAVLDAAESADTGVERRQTTVVATEWESPRCRIDEDWWVVSDAAGVIVAAGWIWPETAGQVPADYYVHPEHRGRGLGETLLDAIAARAGELPSRAGDGTARHLLVWCEDIDHVRRAALERRGFMAVRQSYEMELRLSADLPAPRWPAGIVARRFTPGADERTVFDADQEAFSEHFLFEPRDYEEWRLSHVQAIDTDLALWWLAWDGDQLAGFVIPVSTGPSALIRDLAVRKPWHGRGVGRALLLAAFRTLFERGCTVVRLDVDAQNVTGAVRLYKSVGMRVARRFDVLEKPLATA